MGAAQIGRSFQSLELRQFAQLKPCLAVMEACGGAHHFAREIASTKWGGESVLRAALREVQ